MYCTTTDTIQRVNWPLRSVFSLELERFPLMLNWFASHSFGGQDCACVLWLWEDSKGAAQKYVTYHLSVDLDLYNSGL